MSERSGVSGRSLWADADGEATVRRFRALVDAVEGRVCHLDPDGRVVELDPALAATLGYERTDLVGEHVSTVLADRDADRLQSAVRSVRGSEDDVATLRVTVETAAGDRRVWDLRARPLVEDGQFRGTVGIAREGDRREDPPQSREDASRRRPVGASRDPRADTSRRPGASDPRPSRAGDEHRPGAGAEGPPGAGDDRRSGPVDEWGWAWDVSETVERVLAATDVGVLVFDDRDRVAWASDATARYFGVDRESLVGRDRRSVADAVLGPRLADAEPFRDRFLADAGTGDAAVEVRVTPGDDRDERWLAYRSEPVESGRFIGGRVDRFLDVTDRRRAEGRLRERERDLEWFERIVENLPVGVYRNTPGPDGEFVEANSTLADIFDADSREAFMEHRVSDLYPDPDRRQEFSRRLEEAGMVRDVELKQETLEGRTIWISVTAIRTEEDGDVYFDGIVQDVTERKRREQELRRYETLFTESTDVNAVLAPDGTFDYLPPSVEHVLGYAPGDLEGERAFAYIHPDDREHIVEEFGRVVEDPDYRPTNEFRFRHADGSWVWLESTGRNLLEDPDIEGIVAYTRDVTDRRERERELEERERQLSTLMANVPGMVYRCRNERGWPMDFVSEGCRDLTGYDPAALEGGAVSFGADVVHEADREELWEDVQRGLEADGTFLVTYRIVTADGDVRWVRERGRGIYHDGDPAAGGERVGAEGDTAGGHPSAGGDLAALEGVIIDVTERKRLESELDEVFGRVTDAFYALDEQYRFTHVNEEAERLLGYDESDLLGETIWERFPETAENDEIHETIRGAMETQEPTSVEVQSADLGFWVEAHFYPSETGLSVYFRDVTERKRAQQRLEEERDMFAAGPAIVFRWEPDETEGWPVEYVSENVADVFGYTPEELESGQVPYTDLLLDSEIDRIAREVAENSDGSTERFSHEPYRVKTKDGGVRWVKDVTKIVRDEDGEIQNYLGYLVDITERKEREQELAEYEAIVEAVNDGVYVVDGDGRFTMVNEAYAEMLGYDREDLVGEHVSKVVDEDVVERARELETRLREDDDASPVVEADLRTASGERIPAEATFSLLPTEGEETRRIGVARDVSERKERERELREKERRYEAVFEDPNILVGLLDTDGTVIDINETAMEYVDADLAAVAGEPFWETPWWGEGDGVREEVREWTERAAAGEYVDFEADLTRPDGEAYTLSGYFRPVTDEDGEVVSIIVSDRDITERRERERELEESRQRYRTLIENFPNGAVALVDEDIRYQTVGGTPSKTGDVTVDEAEGTPVAEAVSQDVAEELVPCYEAAFDGESSSFELERDGGIFRFQVVPVRDEDGEVFAALGMSQDVTERVEYERELERSERRYRTLAENFPNGAVGVFDEDLRYTLVAGAQVGETLPSADRLEGSRFPEVFPEHTVADLEPMYRAAVEEGETDSTTTTFGGKVWRVWATPLRDADGEIYAGLSFAQDVTERKEREKRLEELVDRLEESNERLEQFAYAASHDLQEPLRMVSSYLSLIERRYGEDLDADGREFLEFAVDGADRMREMIDALLEYSRVETRGEPLEPTDLDAVVADVLADFQVVIEETGAEVAVEPLPTVRGDANQLRQVFGNLLSNAIEYSGDAPPRVRIAGERDGRTVTVSVSDDGIGIDEAHTDRVFEVFQRLHTQDEHAGTGIGLALCRRIVERHGGDIWVDSDPGEGSTFSLTLPAGETDG